MLIASVVGAIASTTAALLIGIRAADLSGAAATIVEWSAIALFPILFVVLHWAVFGRRRWAAIELVIWAGRIDAARYRAVTGIREPTDLKRASAWLAAHPHAAGEPAETTYWRAYVHLLLRQPSEARAELSLVPDGQVWDLQKATMTAQIDLTDGVAVDAGQIDDLVADLPPSDARAIAAIEIGALRSQVAWTCGEDDVAPVLAALPDVEGRAAGTMLRHYWLPLAAMTLVGWSAIWLLFSLLG